VPAGRNAILAETVKSTTERLDAFVSRMGGTMFAARSMRSSPNWRRSSPPPRKPRRRRARRSANKTGEPVTR
jgi:hypothetical protein